MPSGTPRARIWFPAWNLSRLRFFKGRSAWILEWRPHRDDIGLSHLRPIILPKAWGCDRVKDVMRVVYWNSPLWAILETQGEIHKSRPTRLHIADSGRRIDFSDYGGTVLIGAHVKDLRIGWHDDGGELMEWTLPPHLSYNKISGTVTETSQWVSRSFRS